MAARKARKKVDARKGDRHKGRRKSGKYKKGSRKGTWKGTCKGTCNCKSADSETVQTLNTKLQKANDKIERYREAYAELKKLHQWERKWRMHYEGCVRNPLPPA